MRRGAASRRQTLDAPFATGLACIGEPVVETVGTPLPELDAARVQHVTTPVGGQWHVLPGKPRRRLAPPLLEGSPVPHGGTLLRCPGGDAAAARPASEIP